MVVKALLYFRELSIPSKSSLEGVQTQGSAAAAADSKHAVMDRHHMEFV
jgi:hypothetical protein